MTSTCLPAASRAITVLGDLLGPVQAVGSGRSRAVCSHAERWARDPGAYRRFRAGEAAWIPDRGDALTDDEYLRRYGDFARLYLWCAASSLRRRLDKDSPRPAFASAAIDPSQMGLLQAFAESEIGAASLALQRLWAAAPRSYGAEPEALARALEPGTGGTWAARSWTATRAFRLLAEARTYVALTPANDAAGAGEAWLVPLSVAVFQAPGAGALDVVPCPSLLSALDFFAELPARPSGFPAPGWWSGVAAAAEAAVALYQDCAQAEPARLHGTLVVRWHLQQCLDAYLPLDQLGRFRREASGPSHGLPFALAIAQALARAHGPTGSPGLLRVLQRLDLERVVTTGACTSTGLLGAVDRIQAKQVAARGRPGPPATFLACVPKDVQIESVAGSRAFVQASRPTLRNVLDHLAAVYRLDVDAVKAACRAEDKRLLETYGGYDKKYQPDRYVRRLAIEATLAPVLEGRALPFWFLKAPSGHGKTCFVRDLHRRMDAEPDCVVLLARGLSAKPGHLSRLLETIARDVTGPGDIAAGVDPVEAMDACLKAQGVKLVVFLDGINEADQSAKELFEDVRDCLRRWLQHSGQSGSLTSFRVLVTSRPDHIVSWYKDVLAPKSLMRLAAPLPELPAVSPVTLDGLSDDEVQAVLSRARVPQPGADLLRVLQDPLLLGFYCDTASAGGETQRTPLQLIQTAWERETDALGPALVKMGAYDRWPPGQVLRLIHEACGRMLWTGQSQLVAPWPADSGLTGLLTREVMLFEEVGSKAGETRLRFRYDRFASLQIAQHVILHGPSGDRRSTTAVVDTILGVIRQATGVSKSPMQEVICESLVVALGAALERLPHTGARAGVTTDPSVLAAADQLMARARKAFRGLERGGSVACRTAASEVVYRFLVEASYQHARPIVRHLWRWFHHKGMGDRSLAAPTYRRLVFDILRATSPDSARGVAGLVPLAALALLDDRTGDTAVLLHSLYREGSKPQARRILRRATSQLLAKRMLLVRPGAYLSMRSLALSMALVATEALGDEEFERFATKWAGALPATLLALGAATLTDAALHFNRMPVRAEEWSGILHDVGRFREMCRLLPAQGWEQVPAATIDEICELAKEARNAFVTQPLSHALSGAILYASPERRKALLDSIDVRIADLAGDVTPGMRVSDPEACAIGTQTYLLSLMCYHLLVFDVPRAGGHPGERLSREDAQRVYFQMRRLAAEVLLQPPFFGKFQHRPDCARPETSNIVGTLGRAALQLGEVDDFGSLLADVAKRMNSGAGARGGLFGTESFGAFVVEALATLGTLSHDPSPAVDFLLDVARDMSLQGFQPDAEDALPRENADAGVDAVIKALRQIRAIHPTRVERHLVERRGLRGSAGLIVRLRRHDDAEVYRHFSWMFERAIEVVMVCKPDIVRLIRDDVLRNFREHGLSVVTVSIMLRFTDHAKGRPTEEALHWQRVDRLALLITFNPLNVAARAYAELRARWSRQLPTQR